MLLDELKPPTSHGLTFWHDFIQLTLLPRCQQQLLCRRDKGHGGKRESFPILKMDGFIANNPNRNHFLHSNMTERGAYLTHPATNGNIKERFATNTRVDQVIFPPWPVDPRSLEVTISNHLSEFEWRELTHHPKKVTAWINLGQFFLGFNIFWELMISQNVSATKIAPRFLFA